jgi:hypothetical protein
MMKKHISGITAAAVLVSAAGGVTWAQTGSITVQNAVRDNVYLLDLNPAIATALTSWTGQVQPDAKPAASASQAATAAPGGTAPSSQPSASTPAAPAKLTYIDIVIKSMAVGEGRKPSVRYRYNDTEAWKLAKIGDKLKEGVRFQIGFYSAVTLLVGDGQELTFSNPGSFVVNEAYNDGKTDYTRISMKEGKVTFDVKKVRFANDVVITTPDMTLAITGTKGGIQYTPGQATIAFGAEDNRGRIELEHRRLGLKAVMTRAERADSSSFNPASNRARNTQVETASDLGRERDETRVLKRTEGSTQAVPLDLGDTSSATLRMDLLPPGGGGGPGPTPPNGGVPGATSILHLDSTNGTLFETMPPLDTSVLREGLIFNPTSTEGGAAIVTESTGFRRLVYVESAEVAGVVRNHFRSLAIDSPITAAEAVGEISTTGVSAAPLIRGLGAVGSDLFAAGRLGSRDNIYQVDLKNLSLTEVMAPGLQFEGTLGGVNERGTLIAFAVDPGGAIGASLLDRGAIIEMDPRNNYLVSAHSAVNSSLGNIGSVSNPSGLNLMQVQTITGLSADANSVTLSAVVGSDMGQLALLRYETINGTPRLAEVRVAPDGFTTGLASETTATPPAPMILREPSGPIDMVAINTRFAMMAYSQQALGSGVVERALRTEILKGAGNPEACMHSGALTALPAILARHVDERAGIGQTVHEFRLGLTDLHPCLPTQHMQ